MNKILVLGAGRSASSLIRYLLQQSTTMNWQVTVADQSVDLAKEKLSGHGSGNAVSLDVTDDTARKKMIGAHDVVVSLLPPHLHKPAATDCLTEKKNLVTASYVSDEMAGMDNEVKKAGLLFMFE